MSWSCFFFECYVCFYYYYYWVLLFKKKIYIYIYYMFYLDPGLVGLFLKVFFGLVMCLLACWGMLGSFF